MNWWHYLLLANLYLALFYGFYLLLLRTETYFMLNRIYLVSAAILSFFIPMMQSEWVKNLFITQKVQQTIYYIDPGFIYQISGKAESGFTISQVFTTVYWLVSMLLLARLIYRFVLLKRYMQAEQTNNAFSFFGKIKVDENLPQKDVILQHEQVHAIQFHSADVLLFEALTILNWFNPVIYLYRKTIKYNHEFIADRNAIDFGIDKSDYAMLLLSESLGVQSNHLVNSFFNQSLLKQRIMMLHKNPSKRSALLKYGLSAPLFVAMLIFTSATVSEQRTILKLSEKINSDATVREVAVDLSHQINVLPSSAAKLKLPTIIAQKLKGKVVNTFGKPLANVKVNYKQNTINTITNEDGEFEIPEYTEGSAVSFTNTDSVSLVRAFENIAGKLQIIVIEDKKSAANRANMLIVKSPADSDVVSFASVEKLPMFPGGESAFGNYLAGAIRYPKIAKDQKTQGRVIITFVVETDGSLTGIKVLRNIGGGCGPEAIRVLEASPKWIPGTQKGKPVRVAYTMPINFTLDDGKNNLLQGKVKFMDEDSVVKRGRALNQFNNGTLTLSGFGGKDSARQRPPADVVRIQSKIMGIDPIYLLDGKEIDKNALSKTDPNDIESISVFSSKKAEEKFGNKGKNGVVEITMKKTKKP
ncbi:MAG: TonB family protein [Janthinobacterium lividum]